MEFASSTNMSRGILLSDVDLSRKGIYCEGIPPPRASWTVSFLMNVNLDPKPRTNLTHPTHGFIISLLLFYNTFFTFNIDVNLIIIYLI